MEQIKITVSENAAHVLHAYGITPETYGPAYDGESVGLDLYNCGQEIVIPSLKKWHVENEPANLVPTGLRIAVPKGYVAFIKERSSIVKTPLTIRAGVIDPGYTGEVFVNFVNLGDKDITVPTGARLPAQIVVTKCMSSFKVIGNLQFLEETKDAVRKTGSVGSTQSTSSANETNK